MADQRDFVLLPSPDLDAFLSDNHTDFKEVLSSEGIFVEQRVGADPAALTEGRSKDPVSILVASAGVALALVPALTRVLSVLTHKSVLVKEMVLVPVEDSAGNVVKTASGDPCLHWVERARLLESEPESQPKVSVKVEGPVGLKLAYAEK